MNQIQPGKVPRGLSYALLVIAALLVAFLYSAAIYVRYFDLALWNGLDPHSKIHDIYRDVPILAATRILYNFFSYRNRPVPYSVFQIVIYGLLVSKPWDEFAADIYGRKQEFGPDYRPTTVAGAKVPIPVVLLCVIAVFIIAFFVIKNFAQTLIAG